MILKIIKKYYLFILILCIIKNFNSDNTNKNQNLVNRFHELKEQVIALLYKKDEINIQTGKSRNEKKELEDEKKFYESNFHNIIYFSKIMRHDINDNIINESIINEIENVLSYCIYSEKNNFTLLNAIDGNKLVNEGKFQIAIIKLLFFIEKANGKIFIEESIMKNLSNIIDGKGSNLIQQTEKSCLKILEEFNQTIKKEKIDLQEYFDKKEKNINKLFEKTFLSSYKLSLLILSCFFIYKIYHKITKNNILSKKIKNKNIKFIMYYLYKMIYISFFIINIIYIIKIEKEIKNIWKN